jgi:hypothetical protein
LKIENFKIKEPLICGAIVFAFIFFENLFIGNGALQSIIRSIISGVFTFGLAFGLLFVVGKFKKEIDKGEEKKESRTSSSNDVVGSNVDYTIDDEIKNSDIEEKKDTSFDGEDNKVGDSEEQTYTFEDFSDDDMKNNEDFSSSEVDETTDYYARPDNSEKTKEILDMNVTEEEMARAVRTILKRDS